jgi:hypothetical protein
MGWTPRFPTERPGSAIAAVLRPIIAWLRSWLRFVTDEVDEAHVIVGHLQPEKRSQKRSQQVVSRTITSAGCLEDTRRHGGTPGGHKTSCHQHL